MNEKRRKIVKFISEELSSICARLEDIEDEEQECVDNTPENLQDTERYAHAEECVEILSDARADIETIIENLEGV